ncbi:DUF402 domain-containing protein [Pseudalkalibacillus caeni]|uniref:DUF402 domain-containing protein n=1 Tax=Exobacillus caeni TaxID=2574798 RepID=A0A5R9F4M1_9BACL|nr:DUF402 domain-containing protein [Pseudalkalibacillus caeni]TLS36588.1 DUF402 domain-containing protein [Pseudalkalibacillus caeni]
MKRKYADWRNWARVPEREFHVKKVEEPDFNGYIGWLQLKRVREPLIFHYHETAICSADSGYHWFQHFPEGENHVITTMVDTSHSIVQWYIDIIKTSGIDKNGIPWFDDLYLDIVVFSNGKIHLLDEDELLDAYANKKITKEDFTLANNEAKKIMLQLEQSLFPLLQRTATDVKNMLQASHKKLFF